jgi:hypothetical protein
VACGMRPCTCGVGYLAWVIWRGDLPVEKEPSAACPGKSGDGHRHAKEYSNTLRSPVESGTAGAAPPRTAPYPDEVHHELRDVHERIGARSRELVRLACPRPHSRGAVAS